MIRFAEYSIFFRIWFSLIILPLVCRTSHSQTDSPSEVQVPFHFQKGWNLFSLPVVPADLDVATFFEEKTVGKLWTYSEGKYETVESIEASIGYWVYLTDSLSKVITIRTADLGNQLPISVDPDWNLTGTHSPISIPSQSIGTVWHYEDGQYRAANEMLMAGKAYWLNFPGAADIPLGSLEADSDGDGIPDYWEQLWDFKFNSNEDRLFDPDADKLGNYPEYHAGTNPRMADSDEDGLVDGDEFNLYRTNPLNIDSDNDGFSDFEEVMEGGNPLDGGRLPVTTLITSPDDGEAEVALTRETIIRFSRPLTDLSDVPEDAILAELSNDRLPTNMHISPDRKTVTLFYTNPLPSSARIRLTINGDLIADELDMAVDADDDGTEGGIKVVEFETLTLTTLPNTAVCGRIFASEPMLDDNNELVNEPLAGVTITVDGAEDTMKAVTDQFGDFRLDPAPAGRFFVHIDGRTSTNEIPEGAYYPLVGKSWVSQPGEETNLDNIFLPLIPPDTLNQVSEDSETVLAFSEDFITENPEFDGVEVRVPPNALYRTDNGEVVFGGSIGIAPVPPDRLPGPLPEGVNIKDVITIQTDGATNFDTPVPICLPNIDDLPPGSGSALWSFNHDTGKFEIVGSMTVSEDGKLVCSDPGEGIVAPGWHGSSPGSPGGGGEPGGGSPTEPPSCPGPNNPNKNDSHPVYLFSGEFYEEVVDLRIKGRGTDFVWARKYRSKIGPTTSMGNGWDFSYNMHLLKDGRGMRVCDGNTRDDLYRPRPDGKFSFNGFFNELEEVETDRFCLTFADRKQWFFCPFDGSPQEGKIEQIVDRNGNTLSFQYDEQGRLTKITDTLDREILLGYNENDFIETVTDFAGRFVRYEYYDGVEPGGNFGDLKSVTTPTVTDTPNGNDFPEGKTTSYTYTTGFFDNRLNSNLLSITDGRRNTYLENVYAETQDPNDLMFDRIVRQVWGGDTIDFAYIPQFPDPENEMATMKTIVNDRNGNVAEYFFDMGNRRVIYREYTGRAESTEPTTETENRPQDKLREDDPEFFETRWEFNGDYQVTRVLHANGNITENIYESDLDPNALPRTRGNLRTVRRLPGTHTPVGDQDVIEEDYEYDTNFGCPACGFNFVTKHRDGRGNETLSEYDDNGNKKKRTHRIPSIIEEFEYNEFGQMTKHTLPDNGSDHRRVDIYTYYTHNEDDDQEGYLKEEIIDADNFALTTKYAYDLVGNVIRKTDPRDHDTEYFVNELDQVVREISREVEEGSGVRYEKDFFYDANNNVVRTDIINIDDQGTLLENAHFSTVYEYEILNNQIKSCQEVGSFDVPSSKLDCSELPESEFIITEYAYDANRNRALTRFGEATNGNQSTNTMTLIYDERDLVYQEIRAQGDDAQSTTQYDYDGNQNLIRRSIGMEDTPHVYTYIFDSYNRMVNELDPMGNVMKYGYDANHNKVDELTEGELEDIEGSSKNIRLTQMTYVYDDMDRIIREEHEFFNTESQEAIDDGKSITLTEWSDNSQIIKVTNDNNHTGSTSYDTANRQNRITDAKGNTITYAYDPNSNVISVTEVDKSDLGNADQIFTTTFAYDGLDRKIETVDNVGNTNRGRYDSRNNYTISIDALGNTIRYDFDGINRLVKTTRFLTDNGTGTGNPGGEIVTQQTWDDTSRLTSQIDDSSNATAYVYDALNRKIKDIYADDTEHIFTYDVHDNKTKTVDANGSVIDCQYDLLDRQIRKDITVGDSVSDAITFEIYKYDGLSRLIHAEDNDSLVLRSYDSLSHVIKEVLNNQITLCVYDGVGNMTSCTYPGGRQISCTFDELERKKVISDQGGQIAVYFYLGPNRVERRTYGNGTQTDYTYDGISGIDNPENDFGVKRIIRTSHIFQPEGPSNPVVLDDRTFTWDRLGNKNQRKDIRSGGPELTHDYSYDSIYRLIKTVVTDGDSNVTRDTVYNLDGVGNRTRVTENQTPETYTLDDSTPDPADFQLNQYTTTPSDTREYDLNGNLTSTSPGDENNVGGASRRRSITYDYRNQMVSHEDLDTDITSTYSYDALGRRIQKVPDTNTPSTAILYFYHDWQVCEEQDENNATQATYVYGLYIDEVLNMQREDQDHYYHTDDIYNVMAITDSTGSVVERYEYDDYGELQFFNQSSITIQKSQINNPYLFTGRRYENESDWFYYRTRYLDSQAAKFTIRDGIGIWGDIKNLGNGILYVGNNPTTFSDPSGTTRECVRAALNYARTNFPNVVGQTSYNNFMRHCTASCGVAKCWGALPADLLGWANEFSGVFDWEDVFANQYGISCRNSVLSCRYCCQKIWDDAMCNLSHTPSY